MKKFLQNLPGHYLRSFQRVLSWGLAMMLIFTILGFAHKAIVAVDHDAKAGKIIEQVLAQSPPAPGAPAATPPAPANTSNPATPGGGILGGIGQGVGNVVASLATLLIKLLAGILWFVLYWMGDLMDNTFILEGDIGLKLHSVWVIIRNFVNIFFALALVVVALMSVVGYGDESGNYGLKKFIPKMALALIAVNFTFFACSIVLDINNVLTTAVFDIPRRVTSLTDIGPAGGSAVRTFQKFKCLDPNESFDTAIQRVKKYDEDPRTKGVINQLGGVCFATGPTDGSVPSEADNPIINMGSAQYNQRNFVWAMATQFQGLQDLNKVSQLIDPTFTGLTVNALFSIIFAVIYATAYIAMFIILLARMAVLWITIMLSPLVAISIVFPEMISGEIDIQKQFLDHAFVPLKMAVPLSLGYILISQMTVSIATNTGIVTDKIIDLSQGGEFAHGVSITTLMYGVASIAVIWMAVFTASKDVVGHGFVESIKGYVEGAGRTVAKWPTYLPIIPVAGGNASIANLQGAMGELENTMRESRSRKDKAFYDQTVGKFFPRQELVSSIHDIEQMITDKNFNSEKARSALTNLAATDPARFREYTQKLAGAEFNGQGQQQLASLLGQNDLAKVKGNDAETMAQLETKFKTPGGTTATPSVSTANYGAIPPTALTQTIGLSEQVARRINNADTRRALGMHATENNNQAVKVGDVGLSTFMNNLNDQSKVPIEAFRDIVTSGDFKAMATSPQIQPEIARDEVFLGRLRSLIGNGDEAKSSNRTIRDLYMSFTKKTLTNVNSELGLKEDGGRS